MTDTYENKCRKLRKILKKYTEQNTAVAFSGGVDSSLILKLAVQYAKKQGSRVYAVTADTELHPVQDKVMAEKVAEEMGAEHMILPVRELSEAEIENNPIDRCYRCKKFLFEKILKTGKEKEAFLVLEGTNADDFFMYRPGIRAVRELRVKSPLMEAGFTKQDVRRLAMESGISVADRPSTPCLATRFPYGTKLSTAAMERVEKGENYLRNLGLYNVRLRVHDNLVRIEIDSWMMGKFMENRSTVVAYLKELGYSYVTLDLEGFRSGSMDIGVENSN